MDNNQLTAGNGEGGWDVGKLVFQILEDAECPVGWYDERGIFFGRLAG